MSLEHTVQREAGQKALGRMVNDGEVLRAQVLPSSEPILRFGSAVCVVAPVQKLGAADVQNDRDIRFRQAGPDGLEIAV